MRIGTGLRGVGSTTASLTTFMACHAAPPMLLQPGPVSGVMDAASGNVEEQAGMYRREVVQPDGRTRLEDFVWGQDPTNGPRVFGKEGTYWDILQAYFEPTLAISKRNQCVVSAGIAKWPVDLRPSKVGFADSLWSFDLTDPEGDPIPLVIEGLPYDPNLEDDTRVWQYFNSPKLIGDNIVWFRAGRKNTVTGVTVDGLFRLAADGTPTAILLGGSTTVTDLGVVAGRNTVGAFDVSPTGTNHIAVVTTPSESPLGTQSVALNKKLLTVGSNPLSVGASSGLPNVSGPEQWKRFRHVAVTDRPTGAPRWALAAESSLAGIHNEVVLASGILVAREGTSFQGKVLRGPVQSLSMNESGDLLHVWGVRGSDETVVLVNNTVILRTGDAIDANIDGVIDLGNGDLTFTKAVGISTASLSDRNADGDVQVLVPAVLQGGGHGVVQLIVQVSSSATCPADFNGSGAVSVQDLFDFLAAYFAANIAADFNASGTVTVQDIFDYLAAYFGGCY